MPKERFKLGPFVALLLQKDQKILLIKRQNTGCDDGLYGCPGGGVDGNEPVTQALIREAQEELGITLKKEHLRVVHVLHKRHTLGTETVGFFIRATEWDAEPQNMEPDKHEHICWFELDNLPSNIIPSLKHVLEMVEKDIFYSEHGWD